jgi:pimeloyl-ACP methyl ester carboxylesterase
MAVVEYGLRFGAPRGLTERYLRSAVELSPGLQPFQGWVKAEVRRGDPSDIGHAGKALANFDARELSRNIAVPTAVVVTKEDRLIRRSRQLKLAEAIAGARTIEVAGAHNAWLIHPKEFADAIDRGVEMVIEHMADEPSRGAGTAPRVDELVDQLDTGLPV